MTASIKQLIFLVHPCCYEQLDAEAIRKTNLELYVERERQVKRKWLDELAARDGDTLLLQLYGPQDLQDAAKRSMGEANACLVRAEFPGGDRMREFYNRLVKCIRDHLDEHGLGFDPATVTSELWGESFEGCVPGYGGAFAEYLGLERAPVMSFEMTVFDARFLHGARRCETVAIPGTDIEAWMFECHDGTGAAIYQARRCAQWLDERPIGLTLDPTRVMVTDKRSHTVWPPKPWEKGDPTDPLPVTLTTADCRWVKTINMGFDELKGVAASATVGVSDG